MRGCPYKAVPDPVILFHSDLEDIQAGLLAPYRPDEVPAKFAQMKDLYRAWLQFFRKKAHERKAGGSSMADIEAFRASEGRR